MAPASGRVGRTKVSARLGAAAGGLLLAALVPGTVAAHGLTPVYQSPLPLAVYLAGAAATVALSFLFVLGRDVRAGAEPQTRTVPVPAPVRVALRLAGVGAWAWIMAQGIAGGTSDTPVATLLLWIYGWVGIAAVSALVAPVWEWLDPFATLHDALAWLLRRVGIRGWAPSELPGWARHWPAVLGLGFFIWLELVAVSGAATLTVVLAAYTVLTLALMAQFGRDRWRAQGETFTVWFRTLNRLAPFGIVSAAGPGRDPLLGAASTEGTTEWAADHGGTHPDDETADDDGADGEGLDEDAVDDRVVLRRPFVSGLRDTAWTTPLIVLVAFGTASIIFDGLSQTVAFAALFGAPALLPKTLLLLGFLAIVAGAALGVARTVSPGAIGAGLLPIAVGYLVAHYLTYLLVNGQYLLVALSDPLQRGDDLFGTAFFEPSGQWIPAGLLWTVQLAAVVGGHMLGAWAGHVTAHRDLDPAAGAPADAGSPARRSARDVRLREVPLALVMVALTTLTLWSLGQAIVAEPGETVEASGGGPAPATAARRP